MIGLIAGAKELSFRAEIGRAGDPVAIQLTGHDFDQLSEVAEILKQRYREYPGLYDIQDSFDRGEQEIQLRLRPEAELLGLTTRDLGQQVRAAFLVQKHSAFNAGGMMSGSWSATPGNSANPLPASKQ